MQEGRAEEGKRRLVGRRYQTSGGVVWLVDEGNGEKGSQVASAKVPGAKSIGALHSMIVCCTFSTWQLILAGENMWSHFDYRIRYLYLCRYLPTLFHPFARPRSETRKSSHQQRLLALASRSIANPVDGGQARGPKLDRLCGGYSLSTEVLS